MKIYSITHPDLEGTLYFGSLDEAKDEAQEIADFQKEPVNVEGVKCRNNRDGIIALANHWDHWCVSRETVFTAKPRGHIETEGVVGC